MKVLVIIVSYNFEPWLDLCLGSLRDSDYPVSVMVIDNNSADNTTDRISVHYPEVILIKNTFNKGFGSANNQGFEYAVKKAFDYVFLLNQDAYIQKGTISNLLKKAQENGKFGIISPVHLNSSGNDLDYGFKTYSKLDGILSLDSQQDTVECSFINAALWLVPVTILLKVGGFAPIFSHYGEDVDYVNRVKFKGYKLGYTPSAAAHHCRESRKANREQFLRAEYLYFLTEAVNPNYSLPVAFGYSVLASLKKMLTQWTKLDWKTGFAYFTISQKLLSKYTAILVIRKASINDDAAFLKFDSEKQTKKL